MISEFILYQLAKHWKSPVAERTASLGAELGTDEYAMAYTHFKYVQQIQNGIDIDVVDKTVLEIGTGHGGIAVYMATVGAKHVVGIDINSYNVKYGQRYRKQVESRFGEDFQLPLSITLSEATKLSFPDEAFDVVVAANVFEHFIDPEAVLREAFRVLRPGGYLYVPAFSSIYSKHGLHLKNGLKVPWANLFFSEATIIRVMYKLAENDPKLFDLYPGLKRNPKRVRDLREHGDLNDITYPMFRKMATRTGFHIAWMHLKSNIAGTILRRIPIVKNTYIPDIFSRSAAALLSKP